MIVADTALGEILAESDGLTLYLFEPDRPGKSVCTGPCAEVWPPLLVQGKPTAGDGVDASLLGTVKRKDGGRQVTYNGHPLYRFTDDLAPGDTNGQGVGDVWYVISPAGKAIAGG